MQNKQTNLGEVQSQLTIPLPPDLNTNNTKHPRSREDTEFTLVENSIVIAHSSLSALTILLNKEVAGLLKSRLSGCFG